MTGFDNLSGVAAIEAFHNLLSGDVPWTALAPMQDVTNLRFWRLMSQYEGADVYFTEYFRVTDTSILYPEILASITRNPTGRPVVAQMIGNDIPHLVRIARELRHHPVAAVDLNLGCPAPVVYRKCAGGGLLRDPGRVDRILGTLRDALDIPFTVKTRIGFDDPGLFDELLPIFGRHSLDLLTIHARTVKEMYRSEVHYEYITRAVGELDCPVLANGNIHSALHAAEILRLTGAAGVMIGRGAIRNPWIFQQIRRHLAGNPVFTPSGRDVLDYIQRLYHTVTDLDASEHARVQRIKKHLGFLGAGIDPEGRFLHTMRRCHGESELWAVCREFLDHGQPMPLEPFDLQPAPDRP